MDYKESGEVMTGIKFQSNRTEDGPLFKWLTNAPEHVPARLARYYVYWRIFFSLAAITHGFALSFFLDREIWFMVWFNAYSVSSFAICLMLLRAGYFKTAYWVAITELVGHAVAATVCVGVEFGALGATILILILVFVQPFYSLWSSLSLSALVLATMSITQHYALTHAPIYPEFQVSLSDYAVRIVSWPVLALAMVVPFIRTAARAELELEAAYAESEKLLLNILPKSVASRLKSSDDMIADKHERAAIIFVDIVGFTELSKNLPPEKVVALLNRFFFSIDDIVDELDAEKIKTIGDAYMIAVGAPVSDPNPENKAAELALGIMKIADSLRRPDTGEKLEIRIGAHSGQVIAGVIGKRKFAYDLWGDTVNLASRMESTGQPGCIQVSQEFANHLSNNFYLEPRGEIEAKGHGRVAAYYLRR